MSKSRFSQKLATQLNSIKVPVFVHTINSQDKMYKYMQKETFGFYTDIKSNLVKLPSQSYTNNN